MSNTLDRNENKEVQLYTLEMIDLNNFIPNIEIEFDNIQDLLTVQKAIPNRTNGQWANLNLYLVYHRMDAETVLNIRVISTQGKEQNRFTTKASKFKEYRDMLSHYYTFDLHYCNDIYYINLKERL